MGGASAHPGQAQTEELACRHSRIRGRRDDVDRRASDVVVEQGEGAVLSDHDRVEGAAGVVCVFERPRNYGVESCRHEVGPVVEPVCAGEDGLSTCRGNRRTAGRISSLPDDRARRDAWTCEDHLSRGGGVVGRAEESREGQRSVQPELRA